MGYPTSHGYVVTDICGGWLVVSVPIGSQGFHPKVPAREGVRVPGFGVLGFVHWTSRSSWISHLQGFTLLAVLVGDAGIRRWRRRFLPRLTRCREGELYDFRYLTLRRIRDRFWSSVSFEYPVQVCTRFDRRR